MPRVSDRRSEAPAKTQRRGVRPNVKICVPVANLDTAVTGEHLLLAQFDIEPLIHVYAERGLNAHIHAAKLERGSIAPTEHGILRMRKQQTGPRLREECHVSRMGNFPMQTGFTHQIQE